MLIGCNWSKALKILIENGSIKIDYIKAGAYGTFDEEFSIMRSLRPILLHGLGYFEHAGMKNIEIVDFNLANTLLKKCGSPHYGLHLSIKKSDMSPGMTEENIYQLMSKQIQTFKNNIEVPLLLENTPDSPQYRGWDIHDYIRQLPLDRVKEIHVNGSSYDKDGFPADTHQAMEDEDYKLLEWVLNYTKPDIVTLEYNGIETENDSTIICSLQKQLDEIHNICNLR